MKKMKNLFIATLMFCLLLVPNLNAADKATLGTLRINDTAVAPTENETTKYTYEVPYNTSSASLSFVMVGTENDKTAVADVKKGDETVATGVTTTSVDLAVGPNEFTVDVKDNDATGDATTSTYTVVITRKDKTPAVLSGLVIKANDENGATQTLTPTFSADTKEYSVTVKNEIEKVFIKITKEDGLSVDGDGVKNLNFIGEDDPNIFYITVTNEANDQNQYKISIIREESELIKAIKDEVGNTFMVRELTDDDGKEYITFISYVTSEDETLFAKGYRVLKTDGITSTKVLEQLAELIKKPAEESVVEPGEDLKLNSDILAAIKENGGKTTVFTGSVVVWILDGSQITDDFKEFNVKVLVDDQVDAATKEKVEAKFANKDKTLVMDFAHSGKLPKNTKVSVYVGEKFADGDELVLYYYDDEGKLYEVKKNIVVKDGNAEFELEHCSVYALGLASNNAQTGVLNVALYIVLALSSLTGIIFLLKKKAN